MNIQYAFEIYMYNFNMYMRFVQHLCKLACL